MNPNVNPITGIAYGVISGNSLDGDTLHDLMTEGTNLTERDAMSELRASIAADARDIEDGDAFTCWEDLGHDDRDDYIECEFERRCAEIQIDEPVIEGTCEGVSYMVDWLGGAIVVFILESPVVVMANQCSPCIPGAGDLDHLTDGFGVACYGVPQDWL